MSVEVSITRRPRLSGERVPAEEAIPPRPQRTHDEESDMTCIASWEAVEELGDNCPLCGRACYAHELEEDRERVSAEQAIMAAREGTTCETETTP